MSLPNEPSQGPPSGGVRRDLSGAHGPLLSPSAHPLVIEPLRGWHMPLMQDPAFLDLQPLLQRALLLQGPEQLLHALAARRPLAAQVLVAYRDPQKPLALVVSQRLNRSGSCFELLHLRSAEACLAAPELGGAAVGLALVREAFPRARSAASWGALKASQRCATKPSDSCAAIQHDGRVEGMYGRELAGTVIAFTALYCSGEVAVRKT